jgi:hypothetical protein
MLNEANSILTNFFGKDGFSASMRWAVEDEEGDAKPAAAGAAATAEEEDVDFPDEN